MFFMVYFCFDATKIDQKEKLERNNCYIEQKKLEKTALCNICYVVSYKTFLSLHRH